jgi:hypothetical protein
MGGQLGAGTQSAIQNAAARQSVASGMPGASRISGSIFGNRVLRDIGRSAEDAQQQGFQNYMGTFGTLRPTIGQQLEQGRFDVDTAFRNRAYEDAQRRLRSQDYRQNRPLEYSKKVFGFGEPGTGRYEYRRFI